MDNNEKNFIRSCYLGLGASLISPLFFFICANLIPYYSSPFFNLLVLLLLASPVVGLVFSIIGISKAKQAEKKHIVAGSVGMTISALEVLIVLILALPWLGTRLYTERHPQVIQPHSHDVETNKEDLERMELRRKGYPEGYPEKPLEDFFHLTLEDDYSITRDEQEGFKALQWVIMLDGKVVLKRLAEDELVLEPRWQWRHGSTGKFSICLNAYVDGEYRRVSNIIEYTHLPSDC
ncbi:MAG: hypothetical protein J6W23_14420 [Victivallales bacterium]|nr:hypothetical protein [Victivallales bacterium]